MDVKILDTFEYSWLKDSDLYRELDIDDNNLHLNVIFCSIYEKNIVKYLDVINFWGVNFLPEEFFDLFFTTKPIDKIKELYNLTHSLLYECLISCLRRPKCHIPVIAAENDLLDLMIYSVKKIGLKNNYIPSNTGNNIFYTACSYGSINCIKYLISINKYFVDSKAFQIAASSNKSLEIVTYFNKLGYWNWDTKTTSSAAGAGNLLTLKYLHETKGPHRLSCPWDEKTCSLAARGHIKCLIYAHEASTEVSPGHQRRPHENDCPWDKNTLINASWWDELECLKYAHEKGCPYDKDELLFYNKSRECTDYIIKNM